MKCQISVYDGGTKAYLSVKSGSGDSNITEHGWAKLKARGTVTTQKGRGKILRMKPNFRVTENY